MSNNVVELRVVRPIAHFIRIDGAHKRIGDLHAAGRLPIRRAVFDASRIVQEKELVDGLKRDCVEIVLDTEVAELAAREKFRTHVKNAPWATAAEGRLLDPSFFDGSHSQVNIVRWIARFAVEQGVDSVLAPTHFLGDREFDGWLSLDISSCEGLRCGLDAEGGRHIAIDYPIIHSHTSLNNSDQRQVIVERLAGLPFDNLWVRASGLVNEPKPQAAKEFLTTLYQLQDLRKPIVVDHADGLMTHALLAFGGASGLAQGIAERGRFSAGNWHNLPKEPDPGTSSGRAVYYPIPGLGRRLNRKELTLLASAKGGRKFLGCQDECCKNGVRDMLADPRQHSARQTLAPVREMSKVPDLNREEFFLEKPLRNAERISRNIKDLNHSAIEAEKLEVNLESLKKRMTEHDRKIGKFSDALSLLHDERGTTGTRARPCETRSERILTPADGRLQ